MIFTYRRFTIGGMLNVLIKDTVKKEAEGFDIKCMRLVDNVMMMLPYMQKKSLAEADDILKYLFSHCKASSLPAPKDDGICTDIDVLRTYYHIMKSLQLFPQNPAQYLMDHIKIQGKFVSITDFDGQGNNR